jgi:hypothetical protein
MAIYNLNMAEENLIEEITNRQELERRIPWLNQQLDAVQELKALQAEASTLGRFTKQSGFTKCRTMQRIASIPWPVAIAIKEIDPLFFRNPEKVGKFLKKHPEYCVVQTIK